MEINKIYTGNNLDVLRTFPDNSIDSIVTDPPYGISFMNKKWDYDVPSVETWAEVLRVLKPGGHALVACGTRTQHRMAVNLEDAGFEIRDLIGYLYSTDNAFRRLFNSLDLDQRKLFQMALGNENLFGYLYGSGFPKSQNISIFIDKQKKLQGHRGKATHAFLVGKNRAEDGKEIEASKAMERYIPKSDDSKQWEGWGTALKPAMELWTLCRKPIEGTIAENVLQWGTGGINIDGCRVETNDDMTPRNNKVGQNGVFNASGGYVEPNILGRFPANIILDGSDEVVSLFPNTNPTKPRDGDGKKLDTQNMGWGFKRMGSTLEDNGGSAARFFKQCNYDEIDGQRIYYTPKASQSERNAGLYGNVLDSLEIIIYNNSKDGEIIWKEKITTSEEREVRLLEGMVISLKKAIEECGVLKKKDFVLNTLLFGKQILEEYQMGIKSIIKTEINSTTIQTILNWLRHLTIKEYTQDVNYEKMVGGRNVLCVKNGNILTITISEKTEFLVGVKNVPLTLQLKIKEKENHNIHSTVKPLSLMLYLCRLITPKGGLVLDPFLGSGSTAVAAKLEGFNYIGIELDEKYVAISEARIKNCERDNKTIKKMLTNDDVTEVFDIFDFMGEVERKV